MENLIYYIVGIGIVGLGFSYWRKIWIETQEIGSEKIDNYIKNLTEATKTFIIAEAKVLGVFIVSFSILLFLKSKVDDGSNTFLAISFLVGAILSAISSYFALKYATKANKKTVEAAQVSLNKAFNTAFSGAIYSSITSVSINILGLSVLFFSYTHFGIDWGLTTILNVIFGYVLGTSTVSILLKIGAGTFTNAANESFLLINKNKNGLEKTPELNTVKTSKDISDNINEISGANANLFDSFSISIVAAMLIGASFLSQEVFSENYSLSTILLPLVLSAVGIISSIMGTFLIKSADENNFFSGFMFGKYFSAAIFLIASFFIIKYILPTNWEISTNIGDEVLITKYKSLGIFWTAVIGVVAGIVIELITEFFTKTYKQPTNSVVRSSFIGAWASITKGFEKSMISTVFISLTIVVAIFTSYYFAGYYGIAISAVALLANAGINLSLNSFFAIAEGANKTANQEDLQPIVKQNTEALKDIGINQLPSSKSYSILSSFLAALTVLIVFTQQTEFSLNNYNSLYILIALFGGVMLPFLFSSLIIGGIDRIKSKMLSETDSQIENNKQLLDAYEILNKYDGDLSFANAEEKAIVEEAKTSINNSQFIEISTYYSSLEAIIIGISAIAITIVVGFLFGANILTGLLTGVIISSTLMAFFQSNAAGLWNNTEKMLSDGVQWDSKIYDKDSDAYKTSIIGSLIGNKFKNSTVPTLNIIIKVMVLTALLIATGI